MTPTTPRDDGGPVHLPSLTTAIEMVEGLKDQFIGDETGIAITLQELHFELSMIRDAALSRVPVAGDSVTVRYDLSPAAVEGRIRDALIAMGWTPPTKLTPEEWGREAAKGYKGPVAGEAVAWANPEYQGPGHYPKHGPPITTQHIEGWTPLYAAPPSPSVASDVGEAMFNALGRACIKRIFAAKHWCDTDGDVLLRLESIIRRAEEATAPADAARDAARPTVAELRAWFANRPGVSWQATIDDIDRALAAMTAEQAKGK